MGKITGFLEYPRTADPSEPPEERVKHFNEFHPQLDVRERQRQGARCI